MSSLSESQGKRQFVVGLEVRCFPRLETNYTTVRGEYCTMRERIDKNLTFFFSLYRYTFYTPNL